MRILIVFIAIVLYIFSVSMFVSKTENKTKQIGSIMLVRSTISIITESII